MHLQAFTHRTAYTEMSREPSVPSPLWVAPGNLWEMYPRVHLCSVGWSWFQDKKPAHICRKGTKSLLCEGLGPCCSQNQGLQNQKGKAELPSSQSTMWTCWEGAQQELRVSKVHVKTHLPSQSASRAPNAPALHVHQEGAGGREVPVTSAPVCWRHCPGTWRPRMPKAAELPPACSRQKSQRASMGERCL